MYLYTQFNRHLKEKKVWQPPRKTDEEDEDGHRVW